MLASGYGGVLTWLRETDHNNINERISQTNQHFLIIFRNDDALEDAADILQRPKVEWQQTPWSSVGCGIFIKTKGALWDEEPSNFLLVLP